MTDADHAALLTVLKGLRGMVVVSGYDHPLYREGVVRALEASGLVRVVAEADDGRSALEAAGPFRFHVEDLEGQIDPDRH